MNTLIPNKPENVTLYYREGSSDKVYQCAIEPAGDDRYSVTFAYGRRGGTLSTAAATARHAKLTLVIYMGVSGAQRIQDELLTGLPTSTPVAIVERATLPDQRHAVTTLGQLRATIERDGLASPSVIVVGDVVRGAATLQRIPEATAGVPCSKNSMNSPKAMARSGRAGG